VDDIIVAPTTNVSYLIIDAGGFLGVRLDEVAIPVSQNRAVNGRIVLPGSTKDAILSLPQFEYTTR
jgi:hypothetical protein